MILFRRVRAVGGAMGLLAASAAGLGGAAASTAGTVASTTGPVPMARLRSNLSYASPPTTAQCEQAIGIACYGPNQYQQAYDMAPLYSRGLTGAGTTIAVVDSFGSPTVQRDLAKFDHDFGLPPPPSFKVIQPAGKVPPFDPNDPVRISWALETSLDVQYAHAMAPGAGILLVETPVAETEGVTGFPEIVKAENYVIDHHMADVISQSFGATEETFPDKASLLGLRSAFVNARDHKVSVLGASGDAGSTDYKLNVQDFYTHRVNSWPSTDPLVTSVGGTQLFLDQDGNRLLRDRVWNDTNLFGSPAASGGGVSSVFPRPGYQDGVSAVVGSQRGTPDVSLSAAVDGAALVYLGFGGIGGPGYRLIGGTSEATPLFAGVVAVADQAAGHPLGLLNPRLYRLAASGSAALTDIVVGNNTVTFTQNGNTYTVPGYAAVGGYDLASGLGTVDGNELVAALAH